MLILKWDRSKINNKKLKICTWQKRKNYLWLLEKENQPSSIQISNNMEKEKDLWYSKAGLKKIIKTKIICPFKKRLTLEHGIFLLKMKWRSKINFCFIPHIIFLDIKDLVWNFLMLLFIKLSLKLSIKRVLKIMIYLFYFLLFKSFLNLNIF